MSVPTISLQAPLGVGAVYDAAGNVYTPTGATTTSGGFITVPQALIDSFLKQGFAVPSSVLQLAGGAIGALRIVGVLKGANMNVTTDQAIPLINIAAASLLMIDQIVTTNASTSLTTAAGGFYDTASKGGTAIVAATQAYSALTASTLALRATIAAAGLTWLGSGASTLFLSLTTGQGAAATADIYVFGRVIGA